MFSSKSWPRSSTDCFCLSFFSLLPIVKTYFLPHLSASARNMREQSVWLDSLGSGWDSEVVLSEQDIKSGYWGQAATLPQGQNQLKGPCIEFCLDKAYCPLNVYHFVVARVIILILCTF
jgi:hypothetical protein